MNAIAQGSLPGDKVLKRELEKVEALYKYKELGEGPSPFAALLTEDEAA